jgi:hypothetical protein
MMCGTWVQKQLKTYWKDQAETRVVHLDVQDRLEGKTV